MIGLEEMRFIVRPVTISFMLAALVLGLGIFHLKPSSGSGKQPEMIRPSDPDGPMIYGFKGGIALALYPNALNNWPDGGPRGLIRVGFEENGTLELLNYIAVEPVANGEYGFSELENGGDGKPGKRFWVGSGPNDGGIGRDGDHRGTVIDTPEGRALQFVIHVEDFANGTKPEVEVTLFQKYPDRVRFRTSLRPGSTRPQRLTLTATMGNKERCRNLWLDDKAVYAPALFAGEHGDDFFERGLYPVSTLHKTAEGDVVAAITPDEFEPREAWPFPNDAWHHAGSWRSTYWIKRAGAFGSDLSCRVNGRAEYYKTTMPLPGGIAFENFEFREGYRHAQETWFGCSNKSPAVQFGYGYDVSPPASKARLVEPEEQNEIANALRSHRRLENGGFLEGLKGWTSKGDKFAVFTKDGMGAATSFDDKKEAGKGRIYQCFEVPATAVALDFWEYGGANSDKLGVYLWDGPNLIRRMTGRDDLRPFHVQWDLTRFRGRVVTLEIRDEKAGRWGFIGAGGFTVVTK
jgi:hypothetical protein